MIQYMVIWVLKRNVSNDERYSIVYEQNNLGVHVFPQMVVFYQIGKTTPIEHFSTN